MLGVEGNIICWAKPVYKTAFSSVAETRIIKAMIIESRFKVTSGLAKVKEHDLHAGKIDRKELARKTKLA